MRKIVILTIIFCGLLSADVLPYKPKPIIWVHGLGSASRTWGAPTRNREDWIPAESVAAHPEGTYSHFLNYVNPLVERWWQIDPSYTKQGHPAYPNKTFLEVINFDYDVGSIDAEGPGGWPPCIAQVGQEAELRQRIKEVLAEYYGPNWQSDTSAKVILVCHFMAATSARYAITQDPSLASHINKIHQGDTPLKPPFATSNPHLCINQKHSGHS